MIARDLLGKINFAGKSLQETVQSFIEAGYEVDAGIVGDKLVLNVSQKIEIPLGIKPELNELAKRAKEIHNNASDRL